MEGIFRRVSPAAFADKGEHAIIFRLVRFSPNLEGSLSAGSGKVVMDWTAWLRLSGFADETDAALSLKFSRSPWWHFPAWMITHPEPTVALSGVISLISLALGVISLFLGVASLN